MNSTVDNAILDCKNWKIDSFSVVYDFYIKKIYDFCFYKTYDKEIAEDITSDVFMKAFKSIWTFKWENSNDMWAWIYRIAYNTVIDYYRTKKESVQLENIEETIWYREDFSKSFDEKTKIDEVLKFLETLPEAHKSILTMRIWDDLSYKEISQITGQSVDNCKQIVSRNLRKIQENITFMIMIFFILIK